MFLGHYAAGFAAKPLAPRFSLGAAFLGAQLLDLIWPLLLLAGVEHARIDPGNTAFTPLDFYDYPWTHSLLTAAGWGVAYAIVVYLVTKRPRFAAIGGLLVLSHWLLDAVVHRPDLPLVPHGAAKIGFGLWNHVAATVIVETLLFGIAVALYLRVTRPLDRIGRWALAALILFLVAISAANLVSPPPPSMDAVAWASLSLWLLPLWGWWIDKHREAV